jgi:hypothetical protein
MGIKPSRVAPLFWFTALVHAASVVTRFDKLNEVLPDEVNAAIIFVQFPLLLIVGWYETRIEKNPAAEGMPLWIALRPLSLKISMAFSFAFLCIVIIQTWHLGVGPMDPTPPDVWPQAERAAWYGMFTFGFTGIFMMAAPSVIVPWLRVVTRPFRPLPAILAVPLLTAIGVAAGMGAVTLVANAKLGAASTSLHNFLDPFQQDPVKAIAITSAMVWGPILFGWLIGREAEA